MIIFGFLLSPMTESEYNKLSNTTLYEFSLYHGRKLHGYLEKDMQSNSYHVLMPTQGGKHKKTSENKVTLAQIMDYRPLQVNPTINSTEENTFTINGTPKAKKMVIFGAGASHDYTFDQSINNENRLPLAKNLFDDLYVRILNNYQGAYNLSGEIIKATENIEKYFQAQWMQVINYHDPALLNKLISVQYYLHHLFIELSDKNKGNRKNNYNILIKHVNDFIIRKQNTEHVIFVSFNYDTLIEDAMKNMVGYDFPHTENYIDFNNRKLLLFKPHGSCNWVKKFNAGFTGSGIAKELSGSISSLPRYIYDNNIDLSRINSYLEKDITIVSRSTPGNPNNPHGNWYYYPWLLIPYSDKDECVMPQKHNDIMQHFMTEVEELLIIGWKGTETAFQKSLEDKLGNKEIKVTYVNYDDESIEQVLKKILPKSNLINFKKMSGTSGSFTDFVDYCARNPNYLFSNYPV